MEELLKLPYLGVGNVAEILGVTTARVRQLANTAPGIPGAFKNSSGWQIPPASLKLRPLVNCVPYEKG